MIARRSWLLVVVLGACFEPGAQSSGDGSTSDATSTGEASTTFDESSSAMATSEQSTGPMLETTDASSSGGCPSGVFDVSAWDEGCFAP